LRSAFDHRLIDSPFGSDPSVSTLEILDAESVEFERRLAIWLAGD